MKKIIYYSTAVLMVFGLTFSSCVSKKKFMASEARVSNLKQDSIRLLNDLNESQMHARDLYAEKSNLQNEFALSQEDLKNLSASSEMTISEQAARLRNLENIIQSQKDVMFNLKNSIAEALIKYKADELSVYIKDGNVYVSLEEKLLFKSGSAVVDPKGKEALKSLSQVLNETPDITVVIEGHTDNIPIKTALYKDNWDLSTARATSIVRLLTDDFAVDSKRVTASGKSQFHPVQTNETDGGRASNRRTEIILSPDLNELYKVLYQE
jgi:chemotaxis protein MotB